MKRYLVLVITLLLLGTTHAGTTAVPLDTLLRYCAPHVAPTTMLALVTVESNGWPWSINDDTARRSYAPETYAAAVRLAQQLIREGHTIDVGLAQVDSGNFGTYHLTIAAAFDPCTNVSVGGMILQRAYRAAVQHFGPGQTALYHAFEIYNSGRAFGDDRYARAVWSAAL
ncbi:MAG: lytic transglycosylase domain-containing protein [Vulcanimicrobiaceae bacterium]